MAERTVSPRIENLVDLMDQRFRIPGTRIRYGLDAVLGLVPVVGDVVGAMVGLAVVLEALRLRAGFRVVAGMLLNLWLESAIGPVPVVGDVWDVWFKANRRNLELLKRRLG